MRAIVDQRSPDDLSQLRAWYKIRDRLFGTQDVEQNVKKAIELAACCEHPEAVWLTKMFVGRDVSTKEEARNVFLAFENDKRFAGLLAGSVDLEADIRRAAVLGDAYAQHAWPGYVRGTASLRRKICCSRGASWFRMAWVVLPGWYWMWKAQRKTFLWQQILGHQMQ
jgi:hypothetical protein